MIKVQSILPRKLYIHIRDMTDSLYRNIAAQFETVFRCSW